jgi:hypothetical protein
VPEAINAKADDIGGRAFVEPGKFRLFLECPWRNLGNPRLNPDPVLPPGDEPQVSASAW